MKSLTEMRAQRHSKAQRLVELHKSASPTKGLSAANEQEFDRLSDEVSDLDQEIRRQERADELGYTDEDRAWHPETGGPASLSGARLANGAGGPGRRAVRRHDAVLSHEQRMADWAAHRGADESGFTVAEADDFCIGNMMRAVVDPEFRSQLSDVEQRVLAEGTDSAGGFWTPEPLSVNIIDRIRNAMRVKQAGATTVPLDSDKQSIPRLTGGVSGAWRAENAAFTEVQPSFDRVTFTPRSYGFIVRTSEELYQDMVPGGGRILENEFTQAAALELDRAALRGSGTPPEPTGVRFQSGVTLQSLGANGAQLTRYTDLMTAITTLLTANREPNGVILSPRSSQFLGNLADTTNQPLQPPRPVANLPFYVTGQLPNNITQGTSSDTSEAHVGYWPDLLLGIRLGVQLRLLTERYADVGQYAWRVHMRLDVQVAHPESFVVITGIKP